MAECNECFHYEVCTKLIGKDKIDRISWMCHFPDQCSEFKSTIPKTQADRIRAMSDDELARFITTKIVNVENHKMVEHGHTPTVTQLSALEHTMYCTLMRWLKQPAEGE